MNIGVGDGKVRDLIKKAIDQGFIIEHEKKSIKLIPPDKTKPIVRMACTPSDRNIYWELRRNLRKSGFVDES